MQSTFAINDISVFKQKVLSWLKTFNTFCFLDSNQYDSHYELLIGAGVLRSYQPQDQDRLQELQTFIHQKKSWLFGHLGYELSTSEPIQHTPKVDLLTFPDAYFFEPEIVLYIQKGSLTIIAIDPNQIYEAILQHAVNQIENESKSNNSIQVQSRLNKEAYCNIINQLKNHIQRGDCYEINFCQEFFAQNCRVDPFSIYTKLNQISPNPFSGFYRIRDKWLLCASPERFIQKKGNRILSQPIKGTLQRNSQSTSLAQEQRQLFNSEKDRAENVMVVDLVRNDLSKICREGSVIVDELFGIYSFPQVHQMISTISGTLLNNTPFIDMIDATFPMGSMTGAPKLNVMKLIDRYEPSKRGIFSGALGYMDPNGDFDFNVVIRSLMYNQANHYLSFQAGSGITIYSDAEKEWEECLLKASPIKKILNAL